MTEDDDLTGPATHPETGGDIYHYEWVGAMWCERVGEAFEYPDLPAECPACGEHIPDESGVVVHDDAPSPVIHASDGPRLVLADGSVVSLEVYDGSLEDYDGGDRYSSLGYDQGAARFGPEVDQTEVNIAHVDDPDAENIEAVQEVLDYYGFE